MGSGKNKIRKVLSTVTISSLIAVAGLNLTPMVVKGSSG